MEKEKMDEFVHVVNQYRMLFSRQSPFELSKNEFIILHAVSQLQGKRENGQVCGTTMTAITDLLRCSKPAVSKSVRLVEEKGLIERRTDEKDRRNVYIVLSPEGEAVFIRLRDQMLQMLQRIGDKMGEDDMEEMTRLLAKFYAILEQENQGLMLCRPNEEKE